MEDYKVGKSTTHPLPMVSIFAPETWRLSPIDGDCTELLKCSGRPYTLENSFCTRLSKSNKVGLKITSPGCKAASLLLKPLVCNQKHPHLLRRSPSPSSRCSSSWTSSLSEVIDLKTSPNVAEFNE